MADTPVAPTSIPSWPTPPSRSDEPAEFITEADAFVAAFPTQSTAFNALATNVKFNADSAFASAAEAVVSAGLAEDSATDSAAYAGDSLSSSAISAGAANLKGTWASQTGAANKPFSVTHVGRVWVLLNNLADVTTSEPGVTADWFSVGTMAIQERATNTILAANDYGANIKYTGAGGITQTFQPVASMVDGWYVYLRNDTTGNITLDPDGAEQIDGLASFVMYPGEMRLIEINAAGTGFESTVINGFTVTFDSSGTFTKPPGYTAFEGMVWSAGASGERSNNAVTVARGGAGGGAFPFTFQPSAFGTTETITVGAGGAAVTTVAGGNVGGSSSIGSLLTVAAGGSAYTGGAINGLTDGSTGSIASFAGSASSIVASTIYGGAGTDTSGAAAGNSVYGGGGGGGVNVSSVVGAAGTSVFGGNGGAASSEGNGTAGAQPGGGGGGTQTGTQSGAGGDGRVVIRGRI